MLGGDPGLESLPLLSPQAPAQVPTPPDEVMQCAGTGMIGLLLL